MKFQVTVKNMMNMRMMMCMCSMYSYYLNSRI